MRGVFMIRFILRIQFLLFAVLFLSCTKEPVGVGNKGELLGYRTVEIGINLQGEKETKAGEDNTGNTIKDIKVWAFAVKGNGQSAVVMDEKAVAFATATSSEGSISSLYMELPIYSDVQWYRFFAVANESLLGKVYKARVIGDNNEVEIALDENIQYYTLSRAVFDSNKEGGIMWKSTTNESMPFTHWTDFNLSANSSVDQPTVAINLYRTVAKTVFNAKLSEGSAGNANLIINAINLRAGQDLAVAVQGALFSDVTDVNNATAPGIFGNYSNFKPGYVTGCLNNNFDEGAVAFIPVTVNTKDNFTLVASTYLYENHRGETYSQGVTNTASAADYTAGVYYLEVVYDYTIGNSSETPLKSGKGQCYLPLPAIVRNHKYTINATFDVTNEGSIILASYDVQAWDEITDELDFSYPTISVWAVKTAGGNLDYSKPTMQFKNGFDYNSTSQTTDDGSFPTIENGAFAFNFRMEPGDNAKTWTAHLHESGSGNFGMAVFRIETNDRKTFIHSGPSITIGDDESEKNHGVQYEIRVYPIKNYSSTTAKSADVFITYLAPWLGGAADELLINATSGGTLWADSGGERHKITVTQTEDLSN